IIRSGVYNEFCVVSPDEKKYWILSRNKTQAVGEVATLLGYKCDSYVPLDYLTMESSSTDMARFLSNLPKEQKLEILQQLGIFSCPICEKTLKSKGGLAVHLKKTHPPKERVKELQEPVKEELQVGV